MGLGFLDVQKAIQVHFFGLVIAATLFTIGAGAFIYDFIRYGMPNATPSGSPLEDDASDEHESADPELDAAAVAE